GRDHHPRHHDGPHGEERPEPRGMVHVRRGSQGPRPAHDAERAAERDDATLAGERHSATPFSFRMRHTFSGVMGMSKCFTPRCASASTTALAMAGGAPTVADSPTPLAPNGWCGEGVTVLPVSQRGVSIAVGTR